eukprot:Opistho-2@84286
MLLSGAKMPLKVAVLGSDGVGKTSLIEAFVDKAPLRATYVPTIEDIYEVYIETAKGKVETLHIVDTSGSPTSAQMRQFYIKRAQALILVYDIRSEDSFRYVMELHNEIEQVRGKYAPVFVVGNKLDLDSERTVDPNDAREWANMHGVDFAEMSARNIEDAARPFLEVCRNTTSAKGVKRKVSMKASARPTT